MIVADLEARTASHIGSILRSPHMMCDEWVGLGTFTVSMHLYKNICI